ncbi:MAG: hypothetical protein KGD64_01985 [Candidatus Heimdallarchaeota archaeon]|nr:hypothetical protein [Candidatus Heimdallarchaeota archaeon]
MLNVRRKVRNMPPQFIVPIDFKEEKEEFVKKMFCLNCKERGSVAIEIFKDVIDEGFHYEVARCICDKCNGSFEVNFFPTSSRINAKIKTKNNNLSTYSL